ncbi:hypothetical protein EVAR_19363_1 [Eumeta japonica]|uniref:Uncharacterized protein n=1 Tax=Eumeta variegata TaxID=151549 RepID=A0A4C1TRQ1_EUMVA|nr:hypothetical protein EVAR_19363_1 [Eumeta japonica]
MQIRAEASIIDGQALCRPRPPQYTIIHSGARADAGASRRSAVTINQINYVHFPPKWRAFAVHPDAWGNLEVRFRCRRVRAWEPEVRPDNSGTHSLVYVINRTITLLTKPCRKLGMSKSSVRNRYADSDVESRMERREPCRIDSCFVLRTIADCMSIFARLVLAALSFGDTKIFQYLGTRD